MSKPAHDRKRWLIFPNIDVNYKSLWSPEETVGYASISSQQEDFTPDYYRRIAAFSQKLQLAMEPGGVFHGKTIIMFSHAASTAFASVLLDDVNIGAYRFAPCGIFHFTRDESDHQKWHLRLRGDTNPHCSENSPTTGPWGFNERRSKIFRDMWKTDLHLLRNVLRARPKSKTVPSAGDTSPVHLQQKPPRSPSTKEVTDEEATSSSTTSFVGLPVCCC